MSEVDPIRAAISHDRKTDIVTWRTLIGDIPEDFAWVNIVSTDNEHIIDVLVNDFGFHLTGVEDAVLGHVRPGIEIRTTYCSFVVPAVDSIDGELHYHPIGFFVRNNLLVTVSQEVVPEIEEQYADFMKPGRYRVESCSALLHRIVDAIVDDYFPHLDKVHDAVEDLEDQVFQTVKVEPAEALCLKKTLLEMRRQLSPIRDVMNALLRHGQPAVLPETSADFQDVYNHTIRLTENIDLARDILSTIMDAQLSVVSNRLNEVMRVLTVISTMLMACSLVAGIYGMNFDSIPELHWKYGYLFAYGLMAASCGVIFILFKKKGWI